MKRTLFVLAALAVSMTLANCASAQSLGDLARQQREAKKPSSAKVYTNDDFAAVTEASPQRATTDTAQKSDKADAAPAAKKEDKSKAAADLKAKIDEQKKQVNQLEREFDVAQREYRLKVAVYYADAGNNLRDGKKWAEEDRKQKTEIEGKQKAVNEAKQKLADLQEQARKAGTAVQ